jgi:hypothetical protein
MVDERKRKMNQNMGSADRVIRGIVGVAVLAAGYYFKSWFGLIGLIPLATAFISWCPAYLPFGISTRRAKTDN